MLLLGVLLLLSVAHLRIERCLQRHRSTTEESYSTASTLEKIENVSLMLASLLLTPVYYVTGSPETPALVYVPTDANRRLVARCPAMRRYDESPFLRGHPFLALSFMVFQEVLWCNRFMRVHGISHKEALTMQDGGTVALWWRSTIHLADRGRDDGSDGRVKPRKQRAGETRQLQPKRTLTGVPVVVILPGLNEDATDFPPYCMSEPIVAAGWHCCIYVRRGQSGLPLTSPQPYCMFGADDLHAVLVHLSDAFPESPLLAFGGSTGGGIVQRYMEEKGPASLLSAGASADIGTNWTRNWTWFERQHPWLSTAIMLGKMKGVLRANAAAFDGVGVDPEEVERAEDVKSFFTAYHGKAIQHPTRAPGQTYLDWVTPAARSPARGITAPLLMHISHSDFVMQPSARLALHDAAKSHPLVLLCACEGGSHMMRPEGWSGDGLWLGRTTLEFFRAVLDL